MKESGADSQKAGARHLGRVRKPPLAGVYSRYIVTNQCLCGSAEEGGVTIPVTSNGYLPFTTSDLRITNSRLRETGAQGGRGEEDLFIRELLTIIEGGGIVG